ncbi:MAG: hypothetical protein AB8B72_12935 [Crocinitomicaceae bacterium]
MKLAAKLKKVNRAKFRASKKAPNLVHIQYKKNTVSTIEDIGHCYQAFKELGNGLPVKVLTEIKDSAYFDINESHCLTESDLWPAKEAILTKSLAARLSMNCLYGHKTYHELKVFRTKKSALKWLLTDS